MDHSAAHVVWKVEARVDLIDGRPSLTSLLVNSSRSIDAKLMQRHFRWGTPVEIVTIAIPELIASGIDPFDYYFPLDGYPEAATVGRSVPTRLTDEFLTDIATRYALLGRGYAKAIAAQHNVSTRTVVSWVEKARARGILTATKPGSVGGTVNIRPTV